MRTETELTDTEKTSQPYHGQDRPCSLSHPVHLSVPTMPSRMAICTRLLSAVRRVKLAHIRKWVSLKTPPPTFLSTLIRRTHLVNRFQHAGSTRTTNHLLQCTPPTTFAPMRKHAASHHIRRPPASLCQRRA